MLWVHSVKHWIVVLNGVEGSEVKRPTFPKFSNPSHNVYKVWLSTIL